MKILVTGRTGQLGCELAHRLAQLGTVSALDRAGLDLGRPDSIRAAVSELRPDVIVNAAAYTAVDQAENEPEIAAAINVRGPQILAEAARRGGALLVHYSTDYVFDGGKSAPYVEDDTPNPLGAYGRTKLEGERAIAAAGCRHLIFRTSWVYASRGKNFLLTIRRLAAERSELRVVDDQFGAPTSAAAIATATATILSANSARVDIPSGVFHMTAGGRTSWHGFARLIVDQSGPPFPVVLAVPSSEYPTLARRPHNSCLSNEKLNATFGVHLEPWDMEARRILAGLRAAPSEAQRHTR